MPALVAGIHVFTAARRAEDVDGRDEPGHDAEQAWLLAPLGRRMQGRAPPA
jgi:hypothetical protein